MFTEWHIQTSKYIIHDLQLSLCRYIESNKDCAAYKGFDLLYFINVFIDYIFGMNGLYLFKNFKMGK